VGMYKGVLGELSDHARKALWLFFVLSERSAVEHNSAEVVS